MIGSVKCPDSQVNEPKKTGVSTEQQGQYIIEDNRGCWHPYPCYSDIAEPS
jgi:hypothetical protein